MRFAHLADCHIGAWREPKLKELTLKAFEKAVHACIEKNVDFILIAGDLFNTSLPAIDILKETVSLLKLLQDKGIPVYVIPGSHDFSPSGKTILDVLENAGLITCVNKGNVTDEGKLRLQFTVDKKTGAKITGILGKKGMLDRRYYEELEKDNLEKEKGFKIFMLHTAINEYKPEELASVEVSPLSLLPKHFNYYAAGHVHYVFHRNERGYGLITYPGPLFPDNFRELEQLENGGFFLVDVFEDEQNRIEIDWQPIVVINVHKISVDCDGKSPAEVEEKIKTEIINKEFIDTIVCIRLDGTISNGKPSDINFKEIFSLIYGRMAFFVMKNTSELMSAEFEEIQADASSIEGIESHLIEEHIGKVSCGMTPEQEKNLTMQLFQALDTERHDGETKVDFEKRITQEIFAILHIS